MKMDFFNGLSFALIYIGLPLAGIVALIYLAILFNQTAKTVKRTNQVMDRVENVVEEVEKRVDMLDGPIEAINNIYEKGLGIAASLSAIGAAIKSFGKKRKK